MKIIYTVVIHLIFGGVEEVHNFETEDKANAFILEWCNNSVPEDITFNNAFDGLEWFRINDEKVTYSIQLFERELNILGLFTVKELMDEIARRGVEEGVVESASSLSLMTSEKAQWGVKHQLHKSYRGVDIGNDNYYVDPQEYVGESDIDDLIKKANEFGIGLINVY